MDDSNKNTEHDDSGLFLGTEWFNVPSFSQELWDECKKDRDFRPVLFELYKYTSIVSLLTCSISRQSLSLKEISPVHFSIFMGLFRRCGGLMGSNMRLSLEHQYQETIVIIDRCIVESAIKIQWLCHKDSSECFEMYLADGLKKDVELKKIINQNIQARNGSVLAIEKRMLDSIERCVKTSGMTEQQVSSTKKLSDMFSIYRDLYASNANHFYVPLQRIGSHAVHGSWTDLILHYLEEDKDGELVPTDTKIPVNQNQFILVSVFVLDAVKRFICYMVQDAEIRSTLIAPLDSTLSKINDVLKELSLKDFKSISE